MPSLVPTELAAPLGRCLKMRVAKTLRRMPIASATPTTSAALVALPLSDDAAGSPAQCIPVTVATPSARARPTSTSHRPPCRGRRGARARRLRDRRERRRARRARPRPRRAGTVAVERRAPGRTTSPAAARAAPAACWLARRPAAIWSCTRWCSTRSARARARHQHPAASHPGDRDRAGRAGQMIHRDQWAFDFFPLPGRLRGPVQHHLGDDRLHRGERRDARHPRQPPARGPARVRHADTEPAEMPAGSVLLLHRRALPRRRRQPLERRALRRQPHLRRELAAPGGEPVPGRAAPRSRAPSPSRCCA